MKALGVNEATIDSIKNKYDTGVNIISTSVVIQAIYEIDGIEKFKEVKLCKYQSTTKKNLLICVTNRNPDYEHNCDRNKVKTLLLVSP